MRRKTLLIAAAVLYVVVNAGGAVYAAALGESMHAATHLGLLILGIGAYGMWRLASRSRQRVLAGAPESEEQLKYLQHSVDAIALEVERIGEAQRFSEKLRSGRGEQPPVKKAPEET